MTGKEAFQESIELCDFQIEGLEQTKRQDPMTLGMIKGIKIIRAGLVRKRGREEEENVQS